MSDAQINAILDGLDTVMNFVKTGELPELIGDQEKLTGEKILN